MHFDDGYTPDFPLFFLINVFMIKQASDMKGTEQCSFHAIRCHDIESSDMERNSVRNWKQQHDMTDGCLAE